MATKLNAEFIPDRRLFKPQIVWSSPDLQDLARDFANIVSSCPVGHCTHRVSLPEAFWLWYIIRGLNPEVVVESGTAAGYSLWFLRHAVPKAILFSYDTKKNPRYRLPEVTYYKEDWSRRPPKICMKKRSVAFFDDHVDQGRRLREALSLGINDVFFHDNYHSRGKKAVPIRFLALPPAVVACWDLPSIALPQDVVSAAKNPKPHGFLTWLRICQDTGEPTVRQRGKKRAKVQKLVKPHRVTQTQRSSQYPQGTKSANQWKNQTGKTLRLHDSKGHRFLVRPGEVLIGQWWSRFPQYLTPD